MGTPPLLLAHAPPLLDAGAVSLVAGQQPDFVLLIAGNCFSSLPLHPCQAAGLEGA
jgi:hypothetical protein